MKTKLNKIITDSGFEILSHGKTILECRSDGIYFHPSAYRRGYRDREVESAMRERGLDIRFRKRGGDLFVNGVRLDSGFVPLVNGSPRIPRPERCRGKILTSFPASAPEGKRFALLAEREPGSSRDSYHYLDASERRIGVGFGREIEPAERCGEHMAECAASRESIPYFWQPIGLWPSERGIPMRVRIVRWF